LTTFSVMSSVIVFPEGATYETRMSETLTTKRRPNTAPMPPSRLDTICMILGRGLEDMNVPDSGKILDKIDFSRLKSAENTIPLKSPRNAPSCHLKGSVVP